MYKSRKISLSLKAQIGMSRPMQTSSHNDITRDHNTLTQPWENIKRPTGYSFQQDWANFNQMAYITIFC